jgi:hypothetical protein
MLVGILAGESPAGGTCPVASVVISGGGAGDQSVGSPDVKVLVGWVKAWSFLNVCTWRLASFISRITISFTAARALIGILRITSKTRMRKVFE